MSPYTPEVFARRGIRLNATGELALIAVSAIAALACMAAVMLGFIAVTDALSGTY